MNNQNGNNQNNENNENNENIGNIGPNLNNRYILISELYHEMSDLIYRLAARFGDEACRRGEDNDFEHENNEPEQVALLLSNTLRSIVLNNDVPNNVPQIAMDDANAILEIVLNHPNDVEEVKSVMNEIVGEIIGELDMFAGNNIINRINNRGNAIMTGGRRKRTTRRRKMSRKKSTRRNRKASKKSRKH